MAALDRHARARGSAQEEAPGLPPPGDAPLPGDDLPELVRRYCRGIVAAARYVTIDESGLERAAERWAQEGLASDPPALDSDDHFLDGGRSEVCAYLLTLDAINFGSGWFPTLRKRPGRSGYRTIASALADHFRAHGPWSNAELRAISAETVAHVLGQDPEHPLMALFARALRDLGAFLGEREPLAVVASADGSAKRLAATLARAMPFFDDRGFWKRAQITANDLALASVATFGDLDDLTIFADNLVPHVLRVDGVLRYDPALAARIDRGEPIPANSPPEREIRAAAVCACERLAALVGRPPREIDVWLWNRGQDRRYKARPRHRTRTVFY
ncbi:hypothetical protein JDY09_04325 [Thermoleophilum album]|uniref:queuosine salvage family protein n=1 Tax=Thermoleophilum album TaxID=29539 RepID=UPI00237C7F17|nr:queuosine salvage family protein [Thermoleophilum album]WDT94483.1 hypothetical protein JDY09_04325 [Thermoleophilum album]